MIQLSLRSNIDVSQYLREAVDGGISWVELPFGAEENVIEEAEKICREKQVILTVTDDTELLERKRFHGILFTRNFERIPALRESLGGHPIIGVLLKPGDEFLYLKGWDIDYIVLETGLEPGATTKNFLEEIKVKWDIPVVARCNVSRAEDFNRLLAEGFDGVNTDCL